MHVLVVVIGLLSPLGGLVEVALGEVMDSCPLAMPLATRPCTIPSPSAVWSCNQGNGSEEGKGTSLCGGGGTGALRCRYTHTHGLSLLLEARRVCPLVMRHVIGDHIWDARPGVGRALPAG